MSAKERPVKFKNICRSDAKKILHLTLKKKWFDLIASGEKTKEYRTGKEHWRKRLLDEEGFAIEFDEVHFRNSYHKDDPFMRVVWDGLSHWTGSGPWPLVAEHGELVNKEDFVIQLGAVLEVKASQRKAHKLN